MKNPEIIFESMWEELNDAQNKFPKFNSAHEGYAVMKEEFDELWDLIKVNQSKRDENWKNEAYKEAKQIGAMAARFIVDILNDENWRR